MNYTLGSNIKVQIVYVTPEVNTIIDMVLPAEATIIYAITSSGILAQHPEIDLSRNKIGIFNQQKSFHSKLCDNDRIEIYRPLQASKKLYKRQQKNIN